MSDKSYPTVEAYEKACEALHRYRALAGQLAKAVTEVEWLTKTGSKTQHQCPWCRRWETSEVQTSGGHDVTCPGYTALAAAKDAEVLP